MLTDTMKKRCKAGEVLYGPFIDSGNEDIVEIVALAGFDYIIIDCEHSPADPMMALRMVRAADARRLPSLIRVNNSMPSTILKMMDIGSSGIMAPLIHDAEMARNVGASVRYYPHGRRGTALMRGSDYGFLHIDDYFSKTNSDAFVMVQAESVEAVKNIEEIVQVEEVDAIFIGPYDLSQSMGIPGQVESQPILDIVKSAGKTIRDAGKIPAILAGNYEKAKMFADWGFQLITYSTDLDIFSKAAREIVAHFKGAKQS